ncbi:Uncharacterized conserved protein, DUF305 family [Nocardia amikacinitolerans]|uniref:DUF305 domain-containing protein n=1 Tax=Nocardia amikacinitolerans TaxID=756689 RepID=UPI00083186F1|nr:DUF305 domain-containing protein [Nocardia amikacinitolerans]MCP2319111.1 Uncharacterized conserved protein, DUF305 family [Nocardia amikacinitolerans]
MGAEADVDEPGAETGFKAQVRRQGVALLILGAIGAILLGFAIGTLVRLPLDGGSGEPDPNAVDIGFLQDMSAHHAQAVEMAGIALLRSTDNDVRRLAYDIMTTQQNQVGRMHGWLQLWNKPAQGADGFMGWMSEPDSGHGHGGEHQMSGSMASMPGMATQEELAALRQAPAPEADAMFLRLMLRHHQGGMPMMEYAAKHAATTAVRTLAASMVETQQAESRLLTTMLTARGGTPLPLN